MYQSQNPRLSAASTHSSYKNRVLELSDKLRNLTTQLEKDMNSTDVTKDKKINDLDDKIMKWHEGNNAQFDQIQEKLTQIFTNISDIKNEREQEMVELKNQNNNTSEIYSLENQAPKLSGPSAMTAKMMELLDKNSDSRRETEAKFMKLLDDKTSKLRQEIGNESKARFESIEQYQYKNLSHDYTEFDEIDNEIMK
mmetsp:Transcript_12658/g.11214  ORF Transcript_12658/g.11214 Transcript_12658/m.11214 type:complete len:196 (+) Transcript_12658:31-618(+)